MQAEQYAHPPLHASAAWRFTAEPLLYNGFLYRPTRATRFFDPAVMTRVTAYRGVSVYVDVLQQPSTEAYVPIGRGLMRTYALVESRGAAFDRRAIRHGSRSGWRGRRCTPCVEPAPQTPPGPPAPTHAQSIPPPAGNQGVWLEYDGRRWYSDGEADVFDPSRFTPIGDYHGFTVYRDARAAEPNRIWVEVVKDGPVAPYAAR